MRVCEIFRSLDGEGPHAGLPSVFVRPLACPWCDTMYAHDYGGEEMDVQQVLGRVQALGGSHATLTGGEPLAQPQAVPLVRALLDRGVAVDVETSGAMDVTPVLLPGATVVMDWKARSSGMEGRMNRENLRRLRALDVVKLVVGELADLGIVPWLRSATCARIYVSPVFGRVAPAELAEAVLAAGWEDVRVQVQLHKVIWEPDRRGV